MYCVEAEYIETSGKYHITYLRGYIKRENRYYRKRNYGNFRTCE